MNLLDVLNTKTAGFGNSRRKDSIKEERFAETRARVDEACMGTEAFTAYMDDIRRKNERVAMSLTCEYREPRKGHYISRVLRPQYRRPGEGVLNSFLG